MTSCITHATRERARFRHPALASNAAKAQAMDILKKFDEVLGIKPGHSSLLLFLDQHADLQAICRSLEEALPQMSESTVVAKAHKAGKQPRNQAKAGNARRQAGLRFLLATGISATGLALAGAHRLHALAGGIFAICAARHVWQRRGRL